MLLSLQAAMIKPSSFLSALRAQVRRSVLLVCLYHVVSDWRAGIRLRRGDIKINSGERHANMDVAESLSHIERTYANYLSYAGKPHLAGAVSEIGAGDNFGVALLALKNGAKEYHVVDRFRPTSDRAQQNDIYRSLSDDHGLESLFDGPPSEETIRGLTRHIGVPAERFFQTCDFRFDAIMSIAVLEHLYDPLGALGEMFASLNPGGVLVHRVDLRDHGMFSKYHHPLTFLTIGAALYRRMSVNRGRPNRVGVAAYRTCLSGLGAEAVSVRITRLAGEDDDFPPSEWDQLPVDARARSLGRVRQIRGRLASPFRGADERDLAVSGCLLYARK